MQFGKYYTVKGPGKYIRQVILCVNMKYLDCFVRHVTPEMVILDSYMFCSRCELWALCNFNAALIVLKYFAMKFWLWVV